MVYFDRHRARLDLTVDEYRTLVRMVAGAIDPVHAPPDWIAAGLVSGPVVHPVAAGMARIALQPHRAIAVDRFDGESMLPLFVGWHSTGRATLTERAETGGMSITATHLELLPGLLLQALRVHSGLPDPPDRAPLSTTAAEIDDLLVTGRSRSDGLAEVFDRFERAFRATGSWHGRAADMSVTVVDAGHRGWWRVERDGSDPGDLVTLVPVDVREVRSLLGDVVTGRAAPVPVGSSTLSA